MSNITVLTPTYNRGQLLQKLYKSLCDQDYKDFEWIIIDDGSEDNTRKYVEQMKKAAVFSISYYKKENGGKHTALNYAYQFIQTPLTFIVDSDDFLTSDAISYIEEIYIKYRQEKDLCGFSFLRAKQGGGYLSTSGVPQDGMKESYVECRINRHISGDMAEVWYTHCLKEYPFPEFQGEKFLGEDIIWVRMSQKYKMRFFNHIIYISDYLEDGLTSNRRKHNIKSPNGCVARAEAFLDSGACITTKIKSMLQYQIYGKFAGRKDGDLFRTSSNKILYCAFFVPGLLLYKKWKKAIGNNT
ncbi:glycosyltransferase family A protein [Faecalicoccus pleomorphus]|uniref:glycosyltransferase family A protein n=1 Tax=Faecalicoccus pleomorphus TaxID=1323 RepID=UPI00189ACC05|nr:glycosyltransferase family A protein [Faecalicoccus pleomorphus]MDB7984035.1 glycosyltransferase family A protein [Faecalicoccus pleomorphus]